MANEGDLSQAAEEFDLGIALKNHTLKTQKQLPITGSCYNCREKLGPDLTFCDADCRDDYDSLQAARQRQTGR